MLTVQVCVQDSVREEEEEIQDAAAVIGSALSAGMDPNPGQDSS